MLIAIFLHIIYLLEIMAAADLRRNKKNIHVYFLCRFIIDKLSSTSI